MKSIIAGLTLFALTAGVVAWYPRQDTGHPEDGRWPPTGQPGGKARIDVVFVLDTTGSMSGLIQTAKDKIWSIAQTMASAQPTPDIRVGLVAYRDRGDAYVTHVVDLSSDLDSVYADLMDFESAGGGDTPESVNEALSDAVHRVSWSREAQAYRVIFLVGDAPPHMDYAGESRFPEILSAARARGIFVNTIQCGTIPTTAAPWQRIADLGHGRFFQVEQAGGAVAYTTPFDAELAELSARLDRTRLYYGTPEERDRMERKMAATDKLTAEASVAALARRGAFNASDAGRANRLGEHELVDDVARGKVELAELDAARLPESLKPLAPPERAAAIGRLADERAELSRQIDTLAGKRDAWLEQKVSEDGGAADSLDQKIYEAVSEQAGRFGFAYRGGPDY